jgi:hypothetical protein
VTVGGGVLSGHDYPHAPVAKAVREVLGDLPARKSSWWMRC